MPFCHARLSGLRLTSCVHPKSLNTLGDYLRERRLDLGLLQKDVAVRIGLDQSTVRNCESDATTAIRQYWQPIIQFPGYEPFAAARTLAEELILRRKVLGLSEKNLAKYLRVDPSTLGRWERGERQLAGKDFDRVRAVIAVSVS